MKNVRVWFGIGFAIGFFAAIANHNGIGWAVIGGLLDSAILLVIVRFVNWLRSKAK